MRRGSLSTVVVVVLVALFGSTPALSGQTQPWLWETRWDNDMIDRWILAFDAALEDMDEDDSCFRVLSDARDGIRIARVSWGVYWTRFSSSGVGGQTFAIDGSAKIQISDQLSAVQQVEMMIHEGAHASLKDIWDRAHRNAEWQGRTGPGHCRQFVTNPDFVPENDVSPLTPSAPGLAWSLDRSIHSGVVVTGGRWKASVLSP